MEIVTSRSQKRDPAPREGIVSSKLRVASLRSLYRCGTSIHFPHLLSGMQDITSSSMIETG